MSAGPLPSGDRASAENELLARLGLPPSASPEDIDDLHLAVSQFLAAAPSSLKGWAHAQAAALDEAYLKLTDPVGLQGSALRSPARPPTVVPGGPATPPARRGPVPAAPAPRSAEESAGADSDEDLEALYASVTPSAHRDMLPGKRPAAPAAPAATAVATASAARKHVRTAQGRTIVAPVAAPQPGVGPWKWIAISLFAVLGLVLVVFVAVPFVFNLSGSAANGSNGNTAQASPTAPAIDQAKVAALMQKITANPKDTASLLALGDEFYAGQQFAQAATFYDQLLAIDPNNIKALLARGAVYYNLNDMANAEKLWDKVLALEPNNQEVHYDLGYLYWSQPSPDLAKVVAEWNKVVAIDPTSTLAQTVGQHLDAIASMIPSSTPGASGAASAAPSGSASPAGSPSGSAAPSGSPAPSAAPSASAAASTKP